MEKRRRVTLLDLRLGLFKLTEEEKETVRQVVAPIWAEAALRVYREQQRAAGQAAASKQQG